MFSRHSIAANLRIDLKGVLQSQNDMGLLRHYQIFAPGEIMLIDFMHSEPNDDVKPLMLVVKSDKIHSNILPIQISCRKGIFFGSRYKTSENFLTLFFPTAMMFHTVFVKR